MKKGNLLISRIKELRFGLRLGQRARVVGIKKSVRVRHRYMPIPMSYSFFGLRSTSLVGAGALGAAWNEPGSCQETALLVPLAGDISAACRASTLAGSCASSWAWARLAGSKLVLNSM